MKTQHKIILTILYFFSFSCFANVVIDKAKSNDHQTSGYVENTQVYFSVLDGQSLNPIRAMQRITVELNDKLITIQRSKDHKEFYIKGQDKSGHITLLGSNDYGSIAKVIEALKSSSDSANYPEVFELLNSTFNLLASYPNNMPLLIWTNNKTDIAALTTDTVIDNKRISQVKSVDNVILSNSEKLEFPEIEPYQTNGVVNKSKSQAKILGTGQKFESYNSSTSLCNSISSEKVKGVYPIVAKAPYEKKPIAIPIPTIDYLDMNKQGLISNTWQGELYVKTTKKYDVVVGGKECLGRCGFQCNGILGTNAGEYNVGVATDKNNYSVDCLAHDMCSVKGKGGGGFDALSFECNAIFAHAADDFLNLPNCEHDLKVKNYFVAKSPKATEADTNLKPNDTLYVIYDFTNAGNSKLPHSDISILFSLDGESIGENKISKGTKLEVNEKLKGYRKLGKLSQGKHSINLEIEAPNIIESPNPASQNNFKHEFEVLETCDAKTSTDKSCEVKKSGVSDVSGTYQITGTADETQCGEGIRNFKETAHVKVMKGNQVAVTVHGIKVVAPLLQNTINYTVNYPEDGGITNMNGKILIVGTKQIEGSATWNWSGYGFSCSGTDNFSGQKQN